MTETAWTKCRYCGEWAHADVHQCDARTLPEVHRAPVVVRSALEINPAERNRRPDLSRRKWNAAKDLDRLAKPWWYRHFYGRGVNLEPTIRATGENAVAVDEAKGFERTELAAIHARFESLRTGDGRLHYQVLRFVFLDHAPEQRMPAATLVQQHEDERAQLSEAFLENLGWAFATPAQRKRWRGHKGALAHSLPRKFGEKLYQAAIAAYERGADVRGNKSSAR